MNVVRLSTGGGGSLFVPVVEIEGIEEIEADATVNTSALDELTVEALLQPLKESGELIKNTLSPLKPKSVKVEVSLAVGVKAGRFVSLLVDGKADAGIKVSLEWDLSQDEKQ